MIFSNHVFPRKALTIAFTAATLAVLCLAPSKAAQARIGFTIGVGVGLPAYCPPPVVYCPPPVVYTPPPVYVPPAPVYAPPAAPVYYTPAPVYTPPPAPVYYAPPTVYVQPQVYYQPYYYHPCFYNPYFYHPFCGFGPVLRFGFCFGHRW